jgi:hypothetical protein
MPGYTRIHNERGFGYWRTFARFSEWEYKGKSERKGTYNFLLFLDEKKQKSSD